MGNGNGQQLVPAGEINPQVMGGGMVRQDFGGTQVARGAQTMSDALAAQAKAAVEARYILAMRRPRDIDTVRAVLIRECMRPSFAEDARYSVPRGKKQNERGEWVENFVEGPSIRFAEAAKRAMGNLLTETMVVYDDLDMRQLRVSVTDLEVNDTYSQDVVVTKTVERKSLRRGQVAKAKRTNSYGDQVNIVEASDDDVLNKQQALLSKTMRTLILRLVPGDVIEEAMQRCVQTLNDRAAKDPDAERKRLADAYTAIGILPDQLQKYLGHPLQQTTQAEYAQLRALYTALRDGNVAWPDVLEQRLEARAEDAKGPEVTPPPDAAPAPPPSSTTIADAAAKAIRDVAAAAQQGTPAPAKAPAAAKPPKGSANVKAGLQAQQAARAPAPPPEPADEDEPAWFRPGNEPPPPDDDDGGETPQ